MAVPSATVRRKRSPLILLTASILCTSKTSNAFGSFQLRFSLPKATPNVEKIAARQLEAELLTAIDDQGNRLANSETILGLISKLESMNSISEPAIAPEIYGRWRLLYTNNVKTSSPIQRKAVDAQAFPIYQDIVVADKNQLLVKQIVEFSDAASLSVDALASTTAYPLPELTQRTSTGTVLGFNVLGVSVVGKEAEPDASRPNSRIDFVFDQGNFQFKNGWTIPYPVPFRLPILRDLVKGWIDITWLSDRVRISKGNKGTTFVFIKEKS
jgi:hypothetical protein